VGGRHFCRKKINGNPLDKRDFKTEIKPMTKRKTPTEIAHGKLRERLISYYERRRKDGGEVQKTMASEVPCSVGTLSAYLTRGRDIKGMSAIAIENYLNRMEA
jgi:hypothetical protein